MSRLLAECPCVGIAKGLAIIRPRGQNWTLRSVLITIGSSDRVGARDCGGKSGNMFGIGRLLAVLLCLCPCLALADEAVPVSGAFITLEKATGGTLKYSGTKADGGFVILSLSKGGYRMSITPPKRDRNPDFDHAVKGKFKGIRVIVGGNVVAGPRAPGENTREGSIITIPPSIWQQKAIWLDVEVFREDISGRFDYVLETTDQAVTVNRE